MLMRDPQWLVLFTFFSLSRSPRFTLLATTFVWFIRRQLLAYLPHTYYRLYIHYYPTLLLTKETCTHLLHLIMHVYHRRGPTGQSCTNIKYLFFTAGNVWQRVVIDFPLDAVVCRTGALPPAAEFRTNSSLKVR